MPTIVHERACLVAHDILVTELEPDALVATQAARADAEALRADAESAARLRAEGLAVKMEAELARPRAMLAGQSG